MQPDLEKMIESAFRVMGTNSNITPNVLFKVLFDANLAMVTHVLARQGVGRTDEQIVGMVNNIMDSTWRNPEWFVNNMVAIIEKVREYQMEVKVNG